MKWIEAKPLKGQWVELVPLCAEDVSALVEAVKDGEGWKLEYATVPSPETMAKYVDKALSMAHEGHIAYIVKCAKSGKVLGTTRFYEVQASHKRAAIGYTWYAASARGTQVNTEAKYLLLKHFFEQTQGLSIFFQTHTENKRSRAAIEKLGASLDGVLRSHKILPNGKVRDSVVYSILSSEWPDIKARLEDRLEGSQ